MINGGINYLAYVMLVMFCLVFNDVQNYVELIEKDALYYTFLFFMLWQMIIKAGYLKLCYFVYLVYSIDE